MGFPRVRIERKNDTGAGGPHHKQLTTMLARFLPPVTLDPTTWRDADPEPTTCRGENCDTLVKHEGDLCYECQVCMWEHRND